MAVPIYGPQGAHCLKGPIILGASFLAINESYEAWHKVEDDEFILANDDNADGSNVSSRSQQRVNML